MIDINNFFKWLKMNSHLSESSIKKYTGAVKTISNEMIGYGVIEKSLLDMNLFELDTALINILKCEAFIIKNTTGNSMYSNALKQFRYYMAAHKEDDGGEEQIALEIKASAQLSDTEKSVLIKSRVGQGKYRAGLLRKYNGKCVVTGIDKSDLLIASHIKPWSISNNDERIDIENGLLLCPNFDKLFDCGLLTFSNSGKIYISSFVNEDNIRRLHIERETVVDLKISNRMKAYLDYHRDVLFVR